MAKCLNEAGYPDAASANGALVSNNVPPEQRSSFALSRFICQSMYPTDPKYNRPFSDHQLRVLYAYRVNELKPCLEELGHEISDPPSEQGFIEKYARTGGWDPMLDLGPGKLADADKVCIQLPQKLWE